MEQNQNRLNKQSNSVCRMDSIFFPVILKHVFLVIHYQYNANDKCRVLHRLISLLDILKGLALSCVEVSKMVFWMGGLIINGPLLHLTLLEKNCRRLHRNQTRDLA